MRLRARMQSEMVIGRMPSAGVKHSSVTSKRLVELVRWFAFRRRLEINGRLVIGRRAEAERREGRRRMTKSSMTQIARKFGDEDH